MAADPQVRIEQLNARAVRDLVRAHAARTDEPLVLAVRFKLNDPIDVHLLEIIWNFPGDDDDPAFVTEFAPSADLLILGKLHLTLISPNQLRHAIDRGDAFVADVQGGKVEYRAPDRAPGDCADAFIGELRLQV